MTNEEIKIACSEIISDLDLTTKTASKRVRLNLGKLKNATADIRKRLIEEDKNK